MYIQSMMGKNSRERNSAKQMNNAGHQIASYEEKLEVINLMLCK